MCGGRNFAPSFMHRYLGWSGQPVLLKPRARLLPLNVPVRPAKLWLLVVGVWHRPVEHLLILQRVEVPTGTPHPATKKRSRADCT